MYILSSFVHPKTALWPTDWETLG